MKEKVDLKKAFVEHYLSLVCHFKYDGSREQVFEYIRNYIRDNDIVWNKPSKIYKDYTIKTIDQYFKECQQNKITA
jgi:hypothetical protein